EPSGSRGRRRRGRRRQGHQGIGRGQVRRGTVKFSGIAASPGIAVGPVYVLVSEELAVREFPVPVDRVDDEMKFFERALEASRRDVKQIRNGIATELGEHEAGIYDAHLMILEDPELLKAVT